jgi:hypothetical protein
VRRGRGHAAALLLGAALVVGVPAPPAWASAAARSAHACAVLTQADLERVTGQTVAARHRARLDDGSTQCLWDLNGGYRKEDPTGGTLDVRTGRFDDAKAQIADTRSAARENAGKTRAVRGIGDAALLAGRSTFSVIIAREGRAIVSIGTRLTVGKGAVAPPAGGFAEDEVVRWLTELAEIALRRA